MDLKKSVQWSILHGTYVTIMTKESFVGSVDKITRFKTNPIRNLFVCTLVTLPLGKVDTIKNLPCLSPGSRSMGLTNSVLNS